MAPPRQPVSLADALSLTEEARIITSAAPPFQIVHTNRAWSEATGYKFTEVVGRTCGFLQGEATNGPELLVLHSALQARQPCTTALVNYTATGEPFRNVITVVSTSCGTHFVGTIKVTPIMDGSVAPLERPRPLAQKKPEAVNYAKRENYENAQKRRRREHEHVRLADVLANETDPIVLCAKDYPHQITRPNGAWLEMCGYTLEEVEGLTNKILTGPETDPDCLDDLINCVRKCEPSVQTVVNYKKGGARFINQVATMPVYDENDELAAFMSLLHEIEDTAQQADAPNPGVAHLWAALQTKLDAGVSPAASGAAAAHPAAAREEAARKLLSNHDAVLIDVTGAEAAPASQPELVRVPPQERPYVDQALRETVRRLLGKGADGLLRERLEAAHPAHDAQHAAWAGAADYLCKRIQERPIASGRAPDMSPAAAKALRAVLHEVGHTGL